MQTEHVKFSPTDSAIQSCVILNISWQLLDTADPEVSFGNERAILLLEMSPKKGRCVYQSNLGSSFPSPVCNVSEYREYSAQYSLCI